MDNTTRNCTTETLSRNDTILSNNTTCHCQLTTCAQLVTHKLKGVVCVGYNYINDSLVSHESSIQIT